MIDDDVKYEYVGGKCVGRKSPKAKLNVERLKFHITEL